MSEFNNGGTDPKTTLKNYVRSNCYSQKNPIPYDRSVAAQAAEYLTECLDSRSDASSWTQEQRNETALMTYKLLALSKLYDLDGKKVALSYINASIDGKLDDFNKQNFKSKDTVFHFNPDGQRHYDVQIRSNQSVFHDGKKLLEDAEFCVARPGERGVC